MCFDGHSDGTMLLINPVKHNTGIVHWRAFTKHYLNIGSWKIKLTRSSCKHKAEYELLTSLVCSWSDSTCYRAVIRAGLHLSLAIMLHQFVTVRTATPEPVTCSPGWLISDLEIRWRLLVLEEIAFHFYAEAKTRSPRNLHILHPPTVQWKL